MIRMRSTIVAAVAGAILLLCMTVSAVAQNVTTGAINGRVRDASGADMPGVTVTIKSPNLIGVQTNVTTVEGGYRFPSVPPGEYQSVRFMLGVPFNLNHPAEMATAPPPLTYSGMFWGWQDGYKFLRIDAVSPILSVHLGSVGCYYESPGIIGGCTRPNRPDIHLTPFDPTANAIVADLSAVLADSDINMNQPDTQPGCLSDPADLDCAPIFENLGINATDGSPQPATQRFFRVE